MHFNNPRIWQGFLYLLVVTTVFEGVARKLAPELLADLIFFFKDGICLLLLGLFLVEGMGRNDRALRIVIPWILVALALAPLIILTAITDPVLALFGSKQYLLFPVIAIAVVRAFPPQRLEDFRRFVLFLSLLILPTSLVASAQLGLPSSHWLNLSVGGEDLSGFSAGGRLRVSSTFPFVAQFAMFLNAMVYGLGLRIALGTPETRWRTLGTIPAWALITLFVIAAFSTGSRTSVLGSGVMLAVAAVLTLMGNRPRAALRLMALTFIGIVCFFIGTWLTPRAFEAYEQRHDSERIIEEIAERFEHGFVNWRYGLRDAPPTLFGYGLGVMSNGSNRVSAYAREWRERRIWGEADLPNTLFEGGYWLVFSWMAFRAYFVWICFRMLTRLSKSRLYLGGACLVGYIAVTGFTGTLGIQPPLAIWFWLAVGMMYVIYHVEHYHRQLHAQRREI